MKTCPKGHAYAPGEGCPRCRRDRLYAYRKKHPERMKATHKRSWWKHRDKRLAADRRRSGTEKRKADARRRYAANPEPKRKSAKRDYTVNREARLEQRRQYREENPEVLRNQNLRRKYGITSAIRDAMLAAQGGKCYWCGDPIRVVKTGADRACVDHDGPHTEPCGPEDVRAMLCIGCNTALGKAGSRGMLNERAIAYTRSRPHADLIRRMLSE